MAEISLETFRPLASDPIWVSPSHKRPTRIVAASEGQGRQRAGDEAVGWLLCGNFKLRVLPGLLTSVLRMPLTRRRVQRIFGSNEAPRHRRRKGQYDEHREQRERP